MITLAAGLLGGALEAILDFFLLPAGLRSTPAFMNHLWVHVWLGMWFAAAIALSLSISTRLWARLVSGLLISPILILLARSLTPDVMPVHFDIHGFHCTKGVTPEGWREFAFYMSVSWLVATCSGIALLVLVYHTSLLLFPGRGRAIFFFLPFLLATGLAALLVRTSSEYVFWIDIPEPSSFTWESDHYVLRPPSLSGITYGLSQFVGFVAVCTLGRNVLERSSPVSARPWRGPFD
jgi:hypothetical protein